MAEQMATLEDARQQMSLLPRPIQYWMRWLNIVFLTGMAFVFSYAATRWKLAAYVVRFQVAIPIFYLTRDIDMLGAPHVLFWTPLLIYLPLVAAGDPNFNLLSLYGGWSVLLLLTISISVVFDVRAIIAFFSRN